MKKKRKILGIFAHPDDEAFGPGGTLAKYALEGVEIHLLCATRGEAGQWSEEIKNENEQKIVQPTSTLESFREKELLQSAQVLGVKKVEFLDYRDGTLSNGIYHELADKIMKKIITFKPDIIVTFERRGISGHLDHIAVSFITTYAYLKTKIAKKLYYYCMSETLRDSRLDEYFIYFPEGYKETEITTRINYGAVWDKKVAAMKQHKTQMKDVVSILSRIKKFPKIDNFILQFHSGVDIQLPETDLLAGLN